MGRRHFDEGLDDSGRRIGFADARSALLVVRLTMTVSTVPSRSFVA